MTEKLHVEFRAETAAPTEQGWYYAEPKNFVPFGLVSDDGPFPVAVVPGGSAKWLYVMDGLYIYNLNMFKWYGPVTRVMRSGGS